MSRLHEAQLTVAEYSAYHLRNVVTHLDGLTIARSTKLTGDDTADADDEQLEEVPETSRAMETEFHGGECDDPGEAEDEVVAVEERSSPSFGALCVQHWSLRLSRQSELEAAQRPGRKREEMKQMKAVHDIFHSELESLSPQNGANLRKLQ